MSNQFYKSEDLTLKQWDQLKEECDKNAIYRMSVWFSHGISHYAPTDDGVIFIRSDWTKRNQVKFVPKSGEEYYIAKPEGSP